MRKSFFSIFSYYFLSKATIFFVFISDAFILFFKMNKIKVLFLFLVKFIQAIKIAYNEKTLEKINSYSIFVIIIIIIMIIIMIIIIIIEHSNNKNAI